MHHPGALAYKLFGGGWFLTILKFGGGGGTGGFPFILKRCPNPVGGAKTVAPPVKICFNSFEIVVQVYRD